MNSRKTLAIIMAVSLILGSYQSIAQTAEELFPKGIQLEEVKGELEKAIEVYQTIVTQFSANRPIASQALLHIGICKEKLGMKEAADAYQKVVDKYPEQTEAVKLANEKLSFLLRAGAVAGKNGEASNQKSTKLLLSGTGSGGKLSPDETQVVYRGGEGNLLVKDLKTGIVKTVVKYGERDGDYAVNLVWSPDGRMIEYHLFDRTLKQNNEEVRVIAVNGSWEKKIKTGKLNIGTDLMGRDAWSPDGTKLALTLWDQPMQELRVMDNFLPK